MTARLRRGTRRSQSHDLSAGLAAFRCYRLTFVGAFPTHLLGQGRIREMVALALLLGSLRESPSAAQTIVTQLLVEEEAI